MSVMIALSFLCMIPILGVVSEDQSQLMCVFGTDVIYNATEDKNGNLITNDGLTYPDFAWAKSKKRNQYTVCKCIARPCFRKCCQQWEAKLSTIETHCVNVTSEQKGVVTKRPSVHHDKTLEVIINRNETSEFHRHFDILYGKPCSGPMVAAEIDELEDFHLLQDGKLRAWGGEELHDVFGYCFEVILETGETHPTVCLAKTPAKYLTYGIMMEVSAVLLMITFIIYAALPSLHRMHGRCLMSHVLALFAGFCCLPIISLQLQMGAELCLTLAFIIYYAFLASFFWLNVMCLDIWWTFSGFRPMRGSVKEREHKKFVIYSLYCWGSPLIMLTIALIMDLHPGIPETYEKPGFGEKKCWFRSTISNLIYFSGPIAILIVCNIVLFILTAFKIRQIKRGTKILKKQDSRRHNEEEENNAQRFKLYLKLFSVMGVNWIMEVISFAAGGPDEWWYVTDIMNTLQGLLIFFIFVCKRRIFRLLKERFYPESAGTTNSINTSSTRMTAIRRNGSAMSSTRGSLKTHEGYPMKGMAPSARSDDSDVA